jgi:hypothetical protein
MMPEVTQTTYEKNYVPPGLYPFDSSEVVPDNVNDAGSLLKVLVFGTKEFSNLAETSS